MDSDTGGQFSNGFGRGTANDSQRRAAVDIARKKVLAAYAASAKNGPMDQNTYGQGVYPQRGIYSSPNPATLTGQATLTSQAASAGQATSASQPAPTSQSAHLKDTPVPASINSESWKTYHSAWQNYYQKYYSEYYSNAARNYLARERLKEEREKAEDEEIESALKGLTGRAKTDQASGSGAQASADETSGIRDRLRQKIRKKATDSAKKSRRHRRFIPILAGVFVALLILFLQYNRLIFAPLMAYVSPGNAPASEIEALDPTITQTVSADPRLIIPKLNIDVPINFNVPLSDVMEAMNHGVAHYRIAGASAYPGEIGNFIITGHSAGDVYSSNQYKYIFSGLERLEEGDLVYVNYNSVRYTYKITGKQVIEPTNVSALVVQTDRPLLTLVTCTPLGSSRYRLLVTGEQISPSYDGASYDSGTGSESVNVDEATELPSNEPSFFEGIWNWLTGN